MARVTISKYADLSGSLQPNLLEGNPVFYGLTPDGGQVCLEQDILYEYHQDAPFNEGAVLLNDGVRMAIDKQHAEAKDWDDLASTIDAIKEKDGKQLLRTHITDIGESRGLMKGDVFSDLAGVTLKNEMLVSCLIILLERKTDYNDMECWKVLRCLTEKGETLGYYLSHVKVRKVPTTDIQQMNFLYNLASKLPEFDVIIPKHTFYRTRVFKENGKTLDQYNEVD